MISFSCPGCNRGFQVKDEFAGRTTTCPTCRAPLTVPAVAAPAQNPVPMALIAPPDVTPANNPPATRLNDRWNRLTNRSRILVLAGASACLVCLISSAVMTVVWIISPGGTTRSEGKTSAGETEARNKVSICLDKWISGSTYADFKKENPELEFNILKYSTLMNPKPRSYQIEKATPKNKEGTSFEVECVLEYLGGAERWRFSCRAPIPGSKFDKWDVNGTRLEDLADTVENTQRLLQAYLDGCKREELPDAICRRHPEICEIWDFPMTRELSAGKRLELYQIQQGQKFDGPLKGCKFEVQLTFGAGGKQSAIYHLYKDPRIQGRWTINSK